MLTKSNFINYLQCTKFLWLSKYRKDLKSLEKDENLAKLAESGEEIEKLAYTLFPEGVNAPNSENFNEKISGSRKLIVNRTPVIFQPTITAGELYCRSDILAYDSSVDSWDIIEVKSATKVRELDLYDVCFQKICLTEAGQKVGKVILIHVNNSYVRQGAIEVEKLLVEEDVTSQVNALEDEVREAISSALSVLSQSDEPSVKILGQCHNPYDCPFLEYCHKDFPDHSVYSIANALGEAKLSELVDQGVIEVKDIPAEYLTSHKLVKHHHAVKHDEVHIDKEAIQAEVEKIQYPIYFLDYETYSPAIPMFDGYSPYQRIVFQYSLHVQKSPGAELEHHFFLAKDLADPTAELSASLKKIIMAKGSLIAWYMVFEKGCNTEMGQRCSEYQDFFADINDRMYDLMHVFKEGYYVHKDFHGSASLKKVFPVLIKEKDCSYDSLGIKEGATASNSWYDMVKPGADKEQSERIYGDLLAYCHLDTLAMVKILEKLREAVE